MYQTQKLASELMASTLIGCNLNEGMQQLRSRHPQLEPRHHATIQDVVYNSLRRYGEINFVLERLMARPVSVPTVHALLVISIQQLAWSRAAPYAVVDYAVKTVHHFVDSKGTKGLVNAVLRNFLRRKEELLADAAQDPRARCNHPAWWVDMLQENYPRHWEGMLAAANTHPPMHLRVNTRKTTPEAYLALLEEAGQPARVLDGVPGLRMIKPCPIDRLPHFHEGWCSVQDAGAQWAAPLLDVADGMRVLDACAAPGGKTGHLLELAELELISLELEARRIPRLQSNLHRLGFHPPASPLQVVEGDARTPAAWWDGRPFDRILADLPCSASGVARRNPDIKWTRRPTDIAQFATQQGDILRALWGCLKPGGKLLYVTCSVFPHENQQQIDNFLDKMPDATQRPFSLPFPPDGQLLPSAAYDGFFYALLEKKSGVACVWSNKGK